MRRAARTDANQAHVVGIFIAAGWVVQSTASLGGGFPDLICAREGSVLFVEVKDGDKKPSEQALTEAQVKWHRMWAPHVALHVVATDEEARKLAERG
jgi:Holliday junction resolvase-like predicted endonuclease